MASKYIPSFAFAHPCLMFLAAYFTQATVDSLGTVDDIPVLKDLAVPEGLFKSSRRTKTRSSRASAAAHGTDAAPAISTPASSGGKSGKQIASVAGPSSTANRSPPQVAVQSAAPQQNQGLPPSASPQEFFNAKSPVYSGWPTNSAPPVPTQQPDAYARIYTADPYTSPQPPEGYHVSPSPHIQTPVAPFGYNWPTPSTPVDSGYQSGYPYPVLVDSQKGDPSFHHSPAQSQLYVYGSGFQASLHYHRTASPALSHAHSQFSASSQSQSSSESDSPVPGPVPLRTPVFSPHRLSVVLPTDGDTTKYEIQGIREPDGMIDSKVGLASMESLNRYHPYRREPADDRIVQRLSSRPI